MPRDTLTQEELNILNLIADNDDKVFFASKMLNGFSPNLKPAIEVLKPIISTESVHQWTQRISFNNAAIGKTIQYIDENGTWFDLSRVAYSKSISDASTHEIISNYTRVPQGHYNYSVAYQATSDASYEKYILAQSANFLHEAEKKGVNPEEIKEYKDFTDLVFRGYSTVDLVISSGKSIAAKAFLERNIAGTANGVQVLVPMWQTNSTWVKKDATPTTKIWLNAHNTIITQMGTTSYVETHSKYAVALLSKNYEIAKWILDKGYQQTQADILDLYQAGPNDANDFINYLRAPDTDEDVIGTKDYSTVIGQIDSWNPSA